MSNNAGLVAVLSTFILYAYHSTVEYLDILGIKRKRYIALSKDYMNKLSTFEFEEVINVLHNI